MSLNYSKKVIEEFTHPKNVGEIKNPDGMGEVGSSVCGDVMKITIKVEDGVITDVKFTTWGCSAAIACSSMLTQLVKGKTLEEAKKIGRKEVAEALGGLPPIKMHCSNLASDALKKAIEDYESKLSSEKDSYKKS